MAQQIINNQEKKGRWISICASLPMNNTINSQQSLPHSEDMEKALLSCLFINPFEVDGIIRRYLTAESFYIPRHKIIYETVCKMLAAQKPIKFVSVKECLKCKGHLDEIGGAEGLNEILGSYQHGDAEHCAIVIRQKEKRRTSILYAMKAISLAYDERSDFADVSKRPNPLEKPKPPKPSVPPLKPNRSPKSSVTPRTTRI